MNDRVTHRKITVEKVLDCSDSDNQIDKFGVKKLHLTRSILCQWFLVLILQEKID